MPFVRVDLVAGKPDDYRRAIGDVIYEALVDICKVPKDDRFQVFHELSPECHYADERYLGIKRTKDCVFIQIFFLPGRTVEQKKAFYRAVADGLHLRLGLRCEDVFIGLVEELRENWSFGNGEAQYAT
jgi:phenylpyruvate tautomerase PptA (4-oxalocrotonate tautomerase family)